MKSGSCTFFLSRIATAVVLLGSLCGPIRALAQSSATVITLSGNGLAYSDVTQMVYVSNTNNSTITPVSAVTGAVGTAISMTNLAGPLCAGDGGNYLFIALGINGTNHICQFDVNSQTVVNSWSLGGTYVDDLAPVLGSPAAILVDQKVTNRSPRYAGVVLYDSGVARSNSVGGFEGSNVLTPSRTNKIYGYDNEISPSSTQIYQFDGSGIKQTGGWGTLQGFYYDIFWRAGWLFSTSGQIYDPDRGIQVGTFSNTTVGDDAASGRFYLISSGAIIAYDQNTLQPVEGVALPGLTGTLTNLVRCGTNGFAVRVGTTKVAIVHSSFISSGPPADVTLSAVGPTLPVPTGSPFSYTLTVSNSGPNTASNVVLSQTLPANATFVSVSSSSGSNALQGSALLSTPMSITAGGAVTVTVNFQSLKAGLLSSIASITSDSLDTNLSNNVVHLEFPVGAPLQSDSYAELSLQTTDLAWDKFSGRIFASIPNSNWLQGNSIAALNPTTGNFETRIATAIEPAKLAVSDDGQFLYVGMNNDSSVQRINIPSRSLDIKFPTGLSIVADMGVLPGTPHSIVATVQTTLAVYDDGVRRTNTVGPDEYNFPYNLATTESNSLVYEGMTDNLVSVALDTNGATGTGLGLVATHDAAIKYAAGRIYTPGGRIIDPIAKTVITNLPYSGLVLPDANAAEIYYLTVSGSTGTLHFINISNFVQTATVTVTNISGSVSSLIHWGTDGLAFRTTGNQVFLVRSSYAIETNNPALVVRFTSASFASGNVLLNWQTGTNLTYYLQRSPALGAAAVWTDIFTNSPLNPTNTFSDPAPANGTFFYRLRVPEP